MANGEDVDCNMCQEERSIGYPRPTCEECGMPTLSRRAGDIWTLYIKYNPILVSANGMGGWTLNTNVIERMESEGETDSFLDLAEAFGIITTGLFHREKKEG